ncbi:MAG: ParA family protein [Deltaproteobacteria bacterium]|nr:MAG: ParA family protein [Deltaproteobacteria bacterium]
MRNLLKGGLRRLARVETPKRPLGTKKATVIAVSAQKGGVGKTTTSVTMATALARFHGLRVLLVDLDPQGHVTRSLQANLKPGGGKLSEVLLDDKREAEVMDVVATTGIPNLYLTPFDEKLGATEDLLSTRIGKEFVLKEALDATRTHYDVIVLDCPPNLGNLTLNGLVAADQVLIPCDPSPLALNGVAALVETISTVATRLNPELDVLGVLLTRVDGRNTTLNAAVEEEILKEYGPALLPMRIGISSSLAKAQMEGQDIFAFDPSSRGAAQYKELAAHVSQYLNG